MTPDGGSLSAVSTPLASIARVPDWELSATSCHDTSPVTATSRGGGARKTPAPGRVITSPSAASAAMARDTVTGLTFSCRTSSRLDGSFPSTG